MSSKPRKLISFDWAIKKILRSKANFQEGKAYSEITRVISIAMLYFNFGEGDDYIYQGTTSFIGMHNHTVLKLIPNKRNYISNSQ